jgi:uncharacterized protein (DUF342 family)
LKGYIPKTVDIENRFLINSCLTAYKEYAGIATAAVKKSKNFKERTSHLKDSYLGLKDTLSLISDLIKKQNAPPMITDSSKENH